MLNNLRRNLAELNIRCFPCGQENLIVAEYSITYDARGGVINNKIAPAMTYFRGGLLTQLSSALRRFTTLFGMGRGGATPLQSPEQFWCQYLIVNITTPDVRFREIVD